MNYVLIIHAVQDYQAWKRIFDDAAGIRQRAGEQSYRVLRDQHDANRIVHFSKWASLEQARDFFESPELIEIRQRAGVEAPEFNYLLSLEEGDLLAGQ
jgi:quinol monooxygenase YgiN